MKLFPLPAYSLVVLFIAYCYLSVGYAAEVSYSAFGTAGYAVSDTAETYLKYIDNKGSLGRDSVIGAQADLQFNREWRATLQAKVAGAENKDHGAKASIAWAMLAYRPTDTTLVRLGRMRLPAYMNVENLDVGTTYDMLRLPAELHAISANTDFDGMHAKYSWNTGMGDMSIDGYVGQSQSYWRYYLRDEASAIHANTKINSQMLVFSLQREDNLYRISLQNQQVKVKDYTYAENPYFASECTYIAYNASVPCGVYVNKAVAEGFQGQLDFGNVPTEANAFRTTALNIGADMHFTPALRMVTEYSRRKSYNNPFAPDTHGGYLALFYSVDHWVPYISVARLESTQESRDFYNKVNNNKTTNSDPTLSAALNRTQRIMAEPIFSYDQTTLSLGTSYRLSPTQVIKLEGAHTQIGEMSSFVDAKVGGETGHQSMNVFSVAYSFVFQ